MSDPHRDQIIEWRSKLGSIRCDNGPEYISGKLGAWARKHDSKLGFLQPSKPQQNAYSERYNRDWLAQYLFDSVAAVQN